MRRSNYARRSSLLGRQQRQDALREAHLKSIKLSQGELNELNFRLPQPGPMTEGRATRQFKDVAEAKAYLKDVEASRIPFGLKACAAQDLINKKVSNVNQA